MTYNRPVKILFTELYDEQVSRILTSGEREAAENLIAANPLKSVVIQGTGGVRKVRVGRGSRGKSGGARLVFYFWQSEGEIYMLAAYAKSEKQDLTEAEKTLARRAVETIKATRAKKQEQK
jgi:hypothetical protein